MSWRNYIDTKDRFFSAIVYSLPLIYALSFGQFMLSKLPFLQIIYVPLAPFLILYSAVPFGGLIIFFVLYLAVVRNQRISYFIRFNTLQAILIDILLSLCGLVMSLFLQMTQGGLLLETIYNVIFLAALASCIYAIVQSALGRYAELPTISAAAKSQLPY